MKNTEMMQNQLCLFDMQAGYTLPMRKAVEDSQISSAKLIREKMAVYGIDKLIPEKMLSILTGIDVMKCREYIQKYNVSDLVKFLDTLDITEPQRAKLSLLYEFYTRVNTDTRKERPDLSSTYKAGTFFINYLKFEGVEKFLMACLDARSRLIATVLLSEGTVNEAPVYPREAVRQAIKSASPLFQPCL